MREEDRLVTDRDHLRCVLCAHLLKSWWFARRHSRWKVNGYADPSGSCLVFVWCMCSSCHLCGACGC